MGQPTGVADIKLITRLVYQRNEGADPQNAKEGDDLQDMQERISRLLDNNPAFIASEVTRCADGRVHCVIEFTCDRYDVPVDGKPDPDALHDLKAAIAVVNADNRLERGRIILVQGDETEEVLNA